MPAPSNCPMCGRPTTGHGRHVRFTLPDPVLALPQREATPGTWMSHSTAAESVMMQVPDVGAFVRALLPVHLTGGDSITFGLWLLIDPRDSRLRRLVDVWWDDSRYAHLQLDGWLANTPPPWELLRAPVSASVRDVGETPSCDSSPDPLLQRVLTEEWDRETVLAASGQP